MSTEVEKVNEENQKLEEVLTESKKLQMDLNSIADAGAKQSDEVRRQWMRLEEEVATRKREIALIFAKSARIEAAGKAIQVEISHLKAELEV